MNPMTFRIACCLLLAACGAEEPQTRRVTAPDGVTLDVEVAGDGDPVLLIHGSIFADSIKPLARELDGFRTITYHRRGLGKSDRSGPATIADQAGDARAVLAALGVERAHIVGHSYGGVIALELARATPERVRTLALLEPPVFEVAPSAPMAMAQLGPVIEAYRRGDRPGALDAFVSSVAAPDWRTVIDRALRPTAYEIALTDLDTFFQVELPGMEPWRLGEDASAITMPVLSVVGTKSVPLFHEIHDGLLRILPHAETAEIADVHHMLQLMDAPAVGAAVSGFATRNR